MRLKLESGYFRVSVVASYSIESNNKDICGI